MNFCIWYGFLGFISEASIPVFIYDVEYDYRRLEAERNRLKGDVLYVVNPAFLKGLSGPDKAIPAHDGVGKFIIGQPVENIP